MSDIKKPSPVVDLTAMADLDHQNQQYLVMDFVDDPVVTHTKLVRIILSLQLFDP